MNHNGKLVYAKLEEGNFGLGDRRIFIAKRADRSPRGEEKRRGNNLRRKIDKEWGRGGGSLGFML